MGLDNWIQTLCFTDEHHNSQLLPSKLWTLSRYFFVILITAENFVVELDILHCYPIFDGKWPILLLCNSCNFPIGLHCQFDVFYRI